MNRGMQRARPVGWQAQSWVGAALGLALAIGVGLVVARVLMAPSSKDLRALAVYLAISGTATMGVGWLALRAADRAVGLSLHIKAFLGGVLGSLVCMVNVFITARLMFLSTGHDLKLLIALLMFGSVVSVFFSLWVASTVTSRLMVVASGIGALTAGDFHARVPVPDGHDEVTRLAEQVNALAERLEHAEEQRQSMERERRELTAAISHDLRTPLASVRAMVEALDDHVVEEPAEVARYYSLIRREIERLNRLINDLFELAQIDAGALKLDRAPVALQEIAAEVVDAMQARARQAGVTLDCRAEGAPPEAMLDGSRIERAITNLVRNALEHTPAGGRVEVSVAARDRWLELRVCDTGDGIDPADLPHIWDRFYRAEKSRRRGPHSADGAGLGLAIVRGCVEAHGGSVEVRSPPGEGATFVLRLPT